jgi:hypothetical protein
MGQNGSLEVNITINSHILPMESRGLGQLLEMRFLQKLVEQSHGMEHYGSLEAGITIGSRIQPMGKHGLRPLLETRSCQRDVQ